MNEKGLGKALDLLSVAYEHGRYRRLNDDELARIDAFLASQQGEQHPEQAEGTQGEVVALGLERHIACVCEAIDGPCRDAGDIREMAGVIISELDTHGLLFQPEANTDDLASPIQRRLLAIGVDAETAGAISAELAIALIPAMAKRDEEQYQKARAALAAQPSPAPELERPEVVDGVLLTDCVEEWSDDYGSGWFFTEGAKRPVVDAADYERIVAALRAKNDAYLEVAHSRNVAMQLAQFTARDYKAKRDALVVQLDNLAGANEALHKQNVALSAQLAELRGQEPLAVVTEPPYSDAGGDGYHYEISKRLPVGTKLFTQPVATAQQAVLEILQPIDMKWLRRFAECCEDSEAEGHDLPKSAVRDLEQAGALRHVGFGKRGMTAFGEWLLAAAPQPAKGD